MSDVIGSSHMIQGSLTNFTMDRFGCSNSALALNGGWTQVPSGIYFDSPEFTISVWVNPYLVGPNARSIDFGKSTSLNIFLSLNNDTHNKPNANIINGSSSGTPIFESTQLLVTQKWQLLVLTFNGSSLDLYINGSLYSRKKISFGFSRQKPFGNCFIGKSNQASNNYSYSFLDDLRFYNKSLTQDEIVYLLNENQTGIFQRIFFFIFIQVINF